MAILYDFCNQIGLGIDRVVWESNSEKKWKYIRFGTMRNKTIILLSGLIGSYNLWKDLIHEFLPDYCLMLVRHPLVHDLRDFRAGVFEIMLNEGIIDNQGNLLQPPPHIFAHSVGGRIALDLVNQNPDNFGKITLFNSMAPKVSARHLVLYWLAVLIPSLRLKQRVIKREIISRCCLGGSLRMRLLRDELSRLNENITQDAVTCRLSWLIDEIDIMDVKQPERFLFIDFERDLLKPKWMRRNLEELYSGARFITLSGKGHFSHFTHLDKTKDSIRIHLERDYNVLQMT